jgi:hypothetical protein
MKHMPHVCLSTLLLCASMAASATTPPNDDTAFSEDAMAAVGLAIGTNGLTAQAIFSASPSVNVRLGASGFTLNRDFTQSGVDYTGDATFKDFSSIVDWMPGNAHSFRLSLGAMNFRNNVDVMGQSSLAGQTTKTTTVNNTTTVTDGSTSVSVTANANGSTTLKYAGETYKIDPNKDYVYQGVKYRVAVVNNESVVVNQVTQVQTKLVTELTNVVAQTRLNADVSWDGFAPYVGMGFGQPFNHNRAFSWSVDVGAYYVGKPTIEGQINCSGTSDACAALAGAINADMEKQLSELHNKLDKLTFMPVATVGLSYRF